MAKNNFKKMTSIKDTEGGNFGNYEEAKGGGTPRGGVWGGKSGRVGWSEREKSGELPQNAHREEQPRTNDGKFTYNSTNGKETKYESRGKTVNPLLTGGKNGVYIDDVKDKSGNVIKEGAKTQFANKKGNLYDKYKDSWYQAGSELITKNGRKYSVKLSQNDIWEIARTSFDLSKNAFSFETENFSKAKTGRRSTDEKAAINEARKNKQETFVKDAQSAIAQKSGSQPGQQLSTGITFQLNPGIIASFKKRQAVQQAGMPGAGTATFGQSVAQQPANGPATQLVGMAKPTTNFSQGLLNKLGTFVPGIAIPVANKQNAPAPKVSIGGLGKFKKKI